MTSTLDDRIKSAPGVAESYQVKRDTCTDRLFKTNFILDYIIDQINSYMHANVAPANLGPRNQFLYCCIVKL